MKKQMKEKMKKQGKIIATFFGVVVAVLVVIVIVLTTNLDNSAISTRVSGNRNINKTSNGCSNLWWHNDQSVKCFRGNFCGDFMSKDLRTFKTKSECDKSLNNKNDSPREICKNKCGDGVCQEIVCLGTGCPCSETKTSCPKDCSSSKSRCIKEGGLCGGIQTQENSSTCCAENNLGEKMECILVENTADARGTCVAIDKRGDCAQEGEMCGGIAGIKCCGRSDKEAFLGCAIENNYPDASGTCRVLGDVERREVYSK